MLGGRHGRKIWNMTKTTEAMLAKALRLDRSERAALASELLASLDGPGDPEARDAWEVEIRRRVEAIDAGSMDLEPWEHVRRRIETQILNR